MEIYAQAVPAHQRTAVENLSRMVTICDELPQIANVVDAIAKSGQSTTLLAQLHELENRIAELSDSLPEVRPLDVTAIANEANGFVKSELSALGNLFAARTSQTKKSLRSHLDQLILTPVIEGGRKGYSVSGEWALLPRDHRVCVMVARDGVEPPTPAFSGLRSTN